MPVNPAQAPGFGMYDQYGRRLSARQKLTRETLVFFGNFARQNGVVEHQLDVGFQAVTASQFSNTSQQERCTFFTNNALLFGFGDGLIYGCIDRFLRHRKTVPGSDSPLPGRRSNRFAISLPLHERFPWHYQGEY